MRGCLVALVYIAAISFIVYTAWTMPPTKPELPRYWLLDAGATRRWP
jgi:hypothetical protein